MNLSDALASKPQSAGDSPKPSGAGRDVDPRKLDTALPRQSSLPDAQGSEFVVAGTGSLRRPETGSLRFAKSGSAPLIGARSIRRAAAEFFVAGGDGFAERNTNRLHEACVRAKYAET